MPAYRPPQQILFSPVSNFYKGKAIRQQLEAGEQDAELRDLQIEAFKQEPSKDEEEKARLELEELRLNVEKKRE